MAFAQVTVCSEPSAASRVEWDDGLDGMRRVWGADIEKGIEQAADAHRKGGGAAHSVRVVDVVDVPVDTRADAVRCAAAIAAWTSFGGDESAAGAALDAGGWKVVFPET